VPLSLTNLCLLEEFAGKESFLLDKNCILSDIVVFGSNTKHILIFGRQGISEVLSLIIPEIKFIKNDLYRSISNYDDRCTLYRNFLSRFEK
jgi:hypothetical protein